MTALIPLYAIGVFLSFTLSQAGMARRWWRVGHLAPGEEIKDPGSTLRYERGWQLKMVINGVGSVCTFIVMIIFADHQIPGRRLDHRDPGAGARLHLLPHSPSLQEAGQAAIAG